MKRLSRVLAAVLGTGLLTSCAHAPPGTEAAKCELRRGYGVLQGRMEAVDAVRGELTIVDQGGVRRVITLSERTRVLSDHGAVHYLHFHQGAEVVVRCLREVRDTGDPGADVCPLVVAAECVCLDNAVAVARH